MKRLTREWLDKSEDDFNVATSLSRSRKARLCEDDVTFPKTRDLVALLKLRVPTYPLFAALSTAAMNLNAYAVNIRYPGEHGGHQRSASGTQK